MGVDAAPDGWIAVRYDQDGYVDVKRYGEADQLWHDNEGAETILVDIPIGMREASADPRECDTEARDLLSPERHSSVFPVPIRSAAMEESYEEAKLKQEECTDGSLGTQSHAITPKIRELDELLRDNDTRNETIRESHPEVCFCKLNGGDPMQFSKTGQPAAAFWERVDALETADSSVLDSLEDAGDTIREWDSPECSNDDLLDAFALAVTASDLTGQLRTLPNEPERDQEEIRMEIVYAEP
ncbi:putative RNase H-like nuclease [Halolamina salifodinae]|uniref:Putative RNase H-like nuclease n=1 Tax=Halolamina salifodinae TaxID=1202767 RepID=A0A8T4GZD2_9EURY|nr:putative RNase H-like nuclease [Halolamina salifodinae]